MPRIRKEKTLIRFKGTMGVGVRILYTIVANARICKTEKICRALTQLKLKSFFKLLETQRQRSSHTEENFCERIHS